MSPRSSHWTFRYRIPSKFMKFFIMLIGLNRSIVSIGCVRFSLNLHFSDFLSLYVQTFSLHALLLRAAYGSQYFQLTSRKKCNRNVRFSI